MLFNKAEMLNRRASHPKFKAREIIRALEIKKGWVVADIGAGGGYFTMLFAEAVGRGGKVYAVDTDVKLLNYIEKRAVERKMDNVRIVPAGGDLNLPERGCDLIFLRNVFHHLNQPGQYFMELKKFLKKDGRVAVIDYKKRSGFRFVSFFGHHVEEAFIRETMESAGYILVKRHDFLPEQSFNVFRVG